MNSIIVRPLCEGAIVRDGKMIVEAHSSSTLIATEGSLIVVDTSDVSYRQRVIEGLAASNVDPGKVDTVVNTHLHRDHTGNNHLFPNARYIAHELEGAHSGHEAISIFPHVLAAGVTLVHTPGHTPGSISVFVDGKERTAIVGDAIPTRDNFAKNVPPGISYDADLALASMKRISDWADIIIPGHGPAFRVKD